MTGASEDNGFADTLRLDLADLPGPRLVVPLASAFAAVRVPVAAAAVAPLASFASAAAAKPVASPTSAETLQRRASDTHPDAIARASLFRRRSTDPARTAFNARAVARPVAPPVAARVVVAVEPAPIPIPIPTTIAPLPTAPASIAPGATAVPSPALRLFVRGFTPMEQRLLEGAVRLSERRLPRLTLLSEAEAANADVLMIDGADEAAAAWLVSRPALAGKPTIWVDSRTARPGQTLTTRPVHWPLLPMLLARALENVPGPSWADSMPASATDMAGLSPMLPAPVARVDLNHVLVVDDSLAVRNHLRSLLEARGIRVSEAACVREALAVVETERFTCALMDVLMPDMDGYEGCKRLKSMKSSIGKLPVVMLTSKSSPFDRIRGKMAGCDAYLTKPVAPEQFYATLEAYIGSVARRQPAAAKPSLAMRSA